MKRVLLVLLLNLCLLGSLMSQTWDWVQTIRPGGDEYCWDVANDPQGNVLATGRVKAFSTFGSGSTTSSPPPKSVGETDVFVAKYRHDGTLVWVSRDGGIDADWGRCVTSDLQSNVFVTGDYCDTAYFGTNQLIGIGGTLNRNIFIAKYDSSGVCLWAKTAGNAGGYSRGYGICTDSAGNAYVTGHIYGTSNFDGITFGSPAKSLPFVAKFSPSGTCLWVKHISCQYNGVGNKIRMDHNGNLVVVGGYRGTLTVNGVPYPGNSASWSDVFVIKLDASGNYLWTQTAIGAYEDQAYAVDFDSQNNVYVTGRFANDLTFGSTLINSAGWGSNATEANSLADVFLVKYNSAGTMQWIRTLNNNESAIPDVNDIVGDALKVTKSDKILLVGFLFGNTMVGGTGTLLAGDTAQHTGYVTAFDPDGNLVWYKLRGGGGDKMHTRGVTADDYGNCYVGGEFIGTPISFDSITVSSLSLWDGLIAKLMPPLDPVVASDITAHCEGTNDSIHFSVQQDGYPLYYSWSLPGASPASSAAASPVVQYASPGTYPVTLTIFNGHYSDTTTLSGYITVDSLPVIALGSDTTICDGQVLLLDAGPGFASYTWNDLSNGQNLSVSTAGQYYVEVSTGGGCTGSDSVQVLVDICTALKEEEKASIDIFPNPAVSELFITIPASMTNAVLRIYDSMGKEIGAPITLATVRSAIDVSSLSAGMYYYQLIKENVPVIKGKLIRTGS